CFGQIRQLRGDGWLRGFFDRAWLDLQSGGYKQLGDGAAATGIIRAHPGVKAMERSGQWLSGQDRLDRFGWKRWLFYLADDKSADKLAAERYEHKTARLQAFTVRIRQRFGFLVAAFGDEHLKVS